MDRVLFSYAMALENSKLQGLLSEDGTKNEKILKPKWSNSGVLASSFSIVWARGRITWPPKFPARDTGKLQGPALMAEAA